MAARGGASSLAFVLATLGGIVATAYAGPNLAAVGVTPDDRLLVRPVGLVRLWALSKGIDVPVTAITDVGVSRPQGPAQGLEVARDQPPRRHAAGVVPIPRRDATSG